MGDKSNWKNTNRDILKGIKAGATAVIEPFKSTAKGAIEGVKKIAAPFIKESIYIDKIIKSKKDKVTPELKALTGFKKISKDQSKFKKGTK